jgi:hypothetical protein
MPGRAMTRQMVPSQPTTKAAATVKRQLIQGKKILAGQLEDGSGAILGNPITPGTRKMKAAVMTRNQPPNGSISRIHPY